MINEGAHAPQSEGRITMLWLIWIALILLTPVFAGVRVWFEMRQIAAETPGEAPRKAQ